MPTARKRRGGERNGRGKKKPHGEKSSQKRTRLLEGTSNLPSKLAAEKDAPENQSGTREKGRCCARDILFWSCQLWKGRDERNRHEKIQCRTSLREEKEGGDSEKKGTPVFRRKKFEKNDTKGPPTRKRSMSCGKEKEKKSAGNHRLLLEYAEGASAEKGHRGLKIAEIERGRKRERRLLELKQEGKSLFYFEKKWERQSSSAQGLR